MERYFLAVFAVFACIVLLTGILAPVLEEYRCYRLSQTAYSLAGEVCHQLPTKCVWIFNRPMGLCSRCFGIYAALFLVSVWLLYYGAGLATPRFAILLLPLTIDIAAKTVGWRGTRLISFVTGASGAIGLEMLIVFILTKILQRVSKRGDANSLSQNIW